MRVLAKHGLNKIQYSIRMNLPNILISMLVWFLCLVLVLLCITSCVSSFAIILTRKRELVALF